MKKVLLLCSFAIFAPVQSMQLLRKSIANANNYTTRQAITSMLPFFNKQAKSTILPSPALKSEYKQSHDKQYSHSNNNSNHNNSDQGWSWNFKWGKISSLIPTISAWSFLSKFEPPFGWGKEKTKLQRAIELANHSHSSNSLTYQELIALLQDPEILDVLLKSQPLCARILIALALNRLSTAEEIQICCTILSKYPQEITRLLSNAVPNELGIPGGYANAKSQFFCFDKAKNIKLFDGSSKSYYTSFNMILLNVLEKLSQQKRTDFVINIASLLNKGDTANLWNNKIADLIEYNHGFKEDDLAKYKEEVAFLMSHAGFFDKALSHTCTCREVMQMHLYYALKNNPVLWEAAPKIHNFPIDEVNEYIIEKLRTNPFDLKVNTKTLFINASPEVLRELNNGIAAHVIK